jgi:hypothetical protein
MSKRENIMVMVLLAITIWAARYAQSAHFGLYEDDYSRTPQVLVMSWEDLAHQVFSSFQGLSEHGKQLHSPMIYTLTFLGVRLNGLQGVYWIGFVICVLNAWLFYRLLRRLGTPVFALVGGLAYSLFSADTTQALLTNALGLQPSLTFLLLAFHSFLSNRKLLAYVLASLILLNYEIPFPVFLAAPLLVGFLQEGRRWLGWKDWMRHIAVMGVMVLVVAASRRLVGESRVSELDLETIVRVPLTQMVLGTWTSLRLFLMSRSKLAFINLKMEECWSVLGMFGVLSVALWLGSSKRWNTRLLRADSQGPGVDIKQETLRLLTGLMLLVSAYPLAFTVSASATDGRDSRVHLAAVIGAAWLVAWGGELLFKLAYAYGRTLAVVLRLAIVGGLAVFFTLQVGFGKLIQQDYVNSWQYQRQFWTQLLPLITDAEDGDIILVEPSVLRATGQIGVITWNTPRVLKQIIRFPPDWKDPPRVYRLEAGWEQHLVSAGDLFQIDNRTSFIPESMYVEVESNKVIFIEIQESGLVRHTAPLLLNGMKYPVKARYPVAGEPFIPGSLYNLMILNP